MVSCNRKIAVLLNVYLAVLAFAIAVDKMRKEWLALGLILILAGLALFYLSDISFYQDNYVSVAAVDNSVNFSKGLPADLSLTANFSAGQGFFFNFTKGRFWGVGYDQEHGLEPVNTNFAPGISIMPYKMVEFSLSTPSGDVILSEVYLVGGTAPFAVSYLSQSSDFVPLSDGNLTFINVGMKGTIERTGTYTVKAIDIEPWVMKDANSMYNISSDPTTGDPPLGMSLWSIKTVETKPFLWSSLSAGGVLLFVGVVSSVWATRPERRRKARDSRRVPKN